MEDLAPHEILAYLDNVFPSPHVYECRRTRFGVRMLCPQNPKEIVE